MKEYRENRRSKRNFKRVKYEKEKRHNNKSYNIELRLRRLFHKALTLYTKTGKIMPSKKYSLDYKAIIEKLKPFPEDLSKYHIEHIKPLCSFNFINKDGSTNLKEVQKAFSPENTKWLLAEENLKKASQDKLLSVRLKNGF